MASVMHRKPVGSAGRQPGGAGASFNMQTPKPPPSQYNQERLNSHSRARTNSSGVMPNLGSSNSPPLPSSTSPAYSMTSHHQQAAYQPQAMYPGQQQQHSRRTLSNATSSTSSSNTNLNRIPTNSAYSTNAPRRSTSSRSTSSVPPTSYVALMRKQKATVWCDRAQHEDPRILVAQRQARQRAAAEVAGGHNYAAQSRTSTSSSGVVGGVRSKIRHHGAPKASAYNAGLTPGGAGVPMRLSASEVDDGNNSDEDVHSGRHHTRNGSGRSSLGSGRNRHAPHRSSGMNNAYSNGNTPPGASPVDSIGEEETPMPREDGTGRGGYDYFDQAGGSGSSGEKEERLDVVGGLPNTGKLSAEEQIQRQKNAAEDLRRRGSVDERTMTMSGPRLFVANPDLSD